jgi:thiol-disulfide isomerase/thioredoxin
MKRLILAAGLLALSGVGGLAEGRDEEKDTFAGLRKEYFASWEKANASERRRVLREFGRRFLDLATGDPAGPDALRAMGMSLEIHAALKDGRATRKAVAAVRKHFLAEGRLLALLAQLGGVGEEGRAVIREACEKATGESKKRLTLGLLTALEDGLLDADADEARKMHAELAGLRKIAVDEYRMKDAFVGSKLPDLKSEDLEGKEESLSKYRGKVVVLMAWATWCGNCRAMIPHERELVERLKDRPFALISVSFDAKKETLEKFLKREKMPWTHWWNGRKGGIGDHLPVEAYPRIFVLDGKGVLRFKGVRGERMDRAADLLLKEMEDEKKSD